MKATIKIAMDNAAFTDNEAGFELARILRDAADALQLNGCYGAVKFPLVDVNGNHVGVCEVR